MNLFWGANSKTCCVEDAFCGIDYHSHPGTKRAGMAFTDQVFIRRLQASGRAGARSLTPERSDD